MSKKKILDAGDILANVIIKGMQENKAKEIIRLKIQKHQQQKMKISLFSNVVKVEHTKAKDENVVV